MPFNSALVGSRWGPIEWQASPRAILAFRAVLAPDNAAGLDDAAGSLEALPMQVVTPEWTLALLSREHPDQTLTPEEGRRGVHAAQDSRFFRPIRAGDTLSITAELIAVRASRAGAVSTMRCRTSHAATGEILAESLSVSIFRGVEVLGPDRGEPPQDPPSMAKPDGPPTPLRTARGFPHLYSECADIWNPIHTERQVALAAGLPDILIHGTALWALAGLAAAPEGRRISRLAARFRNPAWAGDAMFLRCGSLTENASPFQLHSEDGRLLCDGHVEVD
jgi:acyl dehydratase